MKPIKNLRTVAEAKAYRLLHEVGKVGGLYHELWDWNTSTIYYHLEEDSESARKELEHIEKIREEILAYLENKFTEKIGEYNEALAAVKADTRPHHKILESEGYRWTKDGWIMEQTENHG